MVEERGYVPGSEAGEEGLGEEGLSADNGWAREGISGGGGGDEERSVDMGKRKGRQTADLC